MPAQFLINLSIALLWVMFKDEDVFRLQTFVIGYVIGIAIIFLMYRFFGNKFYLFRVYAAIKLILLFISELLQSSLHVMKHILKPDIAIRPGIFKYETELRG